MLAKLTKPVSWIVIVLTVAVFIFSRFGLSAAGSLLEDIELGVVIIWIVSVFCVGGVLIWLKQQMMGILTLLFFPLGVFAAPHLLGLSGVFAYLFEGVRFFLQFLLPLWASMILILKSDAIFD